MSASSSASDLSSDSFPTVSEAAIAVHWREEEYVYPPARFIGQANANDPDIRERFTEDKFPECFREYADLLHWDEYWQTTLDTSNPPFWKWFVGGKLNASYNCVDRHLAKDRNKAAIIWVPEPEDQVTQAITYQELYRAGQRDRRDAARFRRSEDRRPRHAAHADGP